MSGGPVVGLVVPVTITGSMGPIRADRIRWDRLVPENLKPVTVVGASARVGQEHPITIAIREQVPNLDDAQLAELRSYMRGRGSRAHGSMSTAEDVDAWIAMIDDEARRRAKVRGSAMMKLIDLLNSTEGT